MRSSKDLTNKLNDSFIELDISSEQQTSLINTLNFIRNKSEETWQHSVGVGVTGKEVGQYMNFIAPKALFYFGLLHDTGKALTDPNSLDKKEGFDHNDKRELSKHPIDGYRILRGVHDASAKVALLHHSFQGKRSYPKSLPKMHIEISNESDLLITYAARIIGLIDFYDAATFRENDRYSPGNPRLPSNKEVKTDLIKCNPDQDHLIHCLYDEGIFGRQD